MPACPDRRERLAEARLYLVTDASMPATAVARAVEGGVDMVQLRDRSLPSRELAAAAERLRAVCADAGALFWVNDDPALAIEVGADGVHVGQDDLPVDAVREQVGPDVLVGLSTHSPAQLEEAAGSAADQLSAGPVWETPTKPGRPAAGLEYVRHAAGHPPPQPWFAIGGIDAGNVGEVAAAGAERIVVVRAVRDAHDPAEAARHLRAAIEGSGVGAAH